MAEWEILNSETQIWSGRDNIFGISANSNENTIIDVVGLISFFEGRAIASVIPSVIATSVTIQVRNDWKWRLGPVGYIWTVLRRSTNEKVTGVHLCWVFQMLLQNKLQKLFIWCDWWFTLLIAVVNWDRSRAVVQTNSIGSEERSSKDKIFSGVTRFH